MTWPVTSSDIPADEACHLTPQEQNSYSTALFLGNAELVKRYQDLARIRAREKNT